MAIASANRWRSAIFRKSSRRPRAGSRSRSSASAARRNGSTRRFSIRRACGCGADDRHPPFAPSLRSSNGEALYSEPAMTLLIRIALVAISAALYFGLAVLGFGGAGAFFANPARIALTIVGAALFAASFFAGGNISPGEREDRGNRWVIAAFTIISLLLAYAPAWCDRHDVLTLDGDAIRWAGVALFAVGGGLRLAPVFVLGRRFSGLVAIQQDHRLVTSGLY